jgi:hypothetical protein
VEEMDAKDVLPLDKNDLPPNFTQSMLKNSKYSRYLIDIDELIEIIEKLKYNIKEKKSVQDFNSVASILNIYTESFKQKYKNGNEKNFESYRLLMNLNSNVQMMGNYWMDANHNIKYVSNYKTSGYYSGSAVNEKMEKLLNIINDTLVVLKESSI